MDAGNLELIPGDLGHAGQGVNLSYGTSTQFKDANQPTTHVFQVGEES